jgi:hypothetical protein
MEDEENNCCECLVSAQKIWDKYKYDVSPPIAITLSVLGASGALLLPHFAVLGSITLAITNTAIFFSGIMLNQLNTENKVLLTDNITLRNEIRTNCTSNTPQNSNTSTATAYETVNNFRQIYNEPSTQ